MNKSRLIVGTLLSCALLTICNGCQYNSQQVERIVSSAPEAILLESIQTPASWTDYTLYSAFTISVPNTMEQSNPKDRYSRQLKDIGALRNDEIVFFQQKTLNKGSMVNADEHYCRVLVKYEKVFSDELLHSWETEVLDADTRAWLLENVNGNLANSQQLLSSPSFEWVDIGGTKAIRVQYKRSGNNGNTTACAMYYLFNYDEMAMVMTAYREQEANLWQCDMENVIRTFCWSKCK